MKIGILGGTFDPPHIGHLVIADQAYAQLGLDKIWFMPVGQPPHKDAAHVSAAEHRVEMTFLSIQDNPHFELNLTDVTRPTPHYIATLFDDLTARYSQCEWRLIIGADSLIELPHWYQPAHLLQLTSLAVAHRSGFQPDLTHLTQVFPDLPQRITWVDSPLIDLSSRDLQRRARARLSLRYVVTREVEQYIAEHRLYQDDQMANPLPTDEPAT